MPDLAWPMENPCDPGTDLESFPVQPNCESSLLEHGAAATAHPRPTPLLCELRQCDGVKGAVTLEFLQAPGTDYGGHNYEKKHLDGGVADEAEQPQGEFAAYENREDGHLERFLLRRSDLRGQRRLGGTRGRRTSRSGD